MRSALLLAGCVAEVCKAFRIGGHGFAHLRAKEYQLVAGGVHAPLEVWQLRRLSLRCLMADYMVIIYKGCN